MAEHYRLYGSLDSQETIALTSVLMAKGLVAKLVAEAPSLSLVLEARSGEEAGPYLRTPDGFLLGNLHSILNWIESAHPDPPLLPRTPVRRTCARLLEDWIEFWLPLWPRRSWDTIEALGSHLERAGCLLGASPTRADWLLAAWLEARVLGDANARRHLAAVAPRLIGFGSDLLARSSDRGEDDAIPISLLDLLDEIGTDYHQYLALNQTALKDRDDRVVMDLGLGKWAFPARRDCETRRLEIADELRTLGREEKHAVRSVLEPVGAWHALTLPDLLDSMDPTDPRSI
jgi:glutathione S-transferase